MVEQRLAEPGRKSFDQRGNAIEAPPCRPAIAVEIERSIDFQLERMDPVAGLAMAGDDRSAGIGMIERDGESGGADDSRCFGGNP